MSARLEIRLFGPLEVLVDGEPMPRLRSRKGYLLLALLALRPGKEVSRDWLCEALWPESMLDQARLSLRQSLNDLRKALGSQAFRVESPSVQTLRFRMEDAWVDALAFDSHVVDDAADPSEIIALYRGPLLAGWQDEAILAEQESRRDAFSRFLRRRASTMTPSEAVPLMRAAVAVDPLNEAAQRGLMRALANGGSLPEAIETYRKFADQLQAQYGLVPDPKTQELHLRLREGLQSAHRERAASAGGESFVPRPLTSLIGREELARSVTDLVRRHRLVTITGLGGVGKTRLSLWVADHLEQEGEFAHGVRFVPLAEVADSALLKTHLLRSLGLKDDGDLAEGLRGRRMLIVLDNCEHLVDEVVRVLAPVLETCPRLHVLATSRERLGIVGEVAAPVAPLAPEAARQLLSERAGRRFGDDEVALADEICRRIDALPLAIELAAARLRALPMAEVLRRLDDRFSLLRSTDRNRPARHRTMEATLEESHRLLNADEQRFFEAVSYFEGGFTLEAAEAVAPGDALGNLSRLLDSSLVYVVASDASPLRYAMLETIREFGRRRLAESGQLEQVQARHFMEMLRQAVQARSMLMGADQVHWIGRLNREQPNLRLALANAATNQDRAELTNALMFYWHLTSNTVEAEHWFDVALAHADGVRDMTMARVYLGAGTMAWHRMNLPPAREWLAKSVEMSRVGDDQMLLASCLSMYGVVLRTLGEFEAAYEISKESIDAVRPLNDTARLARVLANFARAASAADRLEEGERTYLESLRLFREVGDQRDYAHTAQSLAWNLMEQGQLARAKEHHADAIRTLHRLDDVFRLAWSFSGVALVCMREEDLPNAARLLAMVQRLEREHRFEVEVPERKHGDTVRERLGPDEWQRIAAEVETMTVDDAVALCLSVCGSQPITEPVR